MRDTGTEQEPRREAAHGAAGDRRTFTRRIDCADAGPRPVVNPSAGDRRQRDGHPDRGARRKLDID